MMSDELTEKILAIEASFDRIMLIKDYEIEQLNLKIAKVLEMCYQDGYTTWDDSMVPRNKGRGYERGEALEKWERAHGHDVRLKCYAEYGCQLLVDPLYVIEALGEVKG